MVTTDSTPRECEDADSEERPSRPVDYVWAIARISIGWLFLWAYVDQTFGLGFTTPANRAWIYGGSPTSRFLRGGDLAVLAGQPWVDGLFMLGLLGFGVCLVLGVATRAAAVAGGITLVLMWAAELPLAGDPLVNEHIVYTIVLAGLAGLAMANAGDTLGLGRLVSKPYLK
ncbi:hypothetical protein AB0B45_10615 [Nonomuraea sp. NPDC049152]|uniref:hypothetical protein n=1 Tax=Nonomuraea sp. NPDC049152 TaxID=3154350 RepID=UPI0033C1C807